MRCLATGTSIVCVLIATVVTAQTATSTADSASQPAVTTQPDELSQRLGDPLPNLQLQGATLPDVLAKLSEVSGVSIRVEPSALLRLPGGAKTKLAKLATENASLRHVLTRILAPLGLQFSLDDSAVNISSVPVMDRLERSATWDELKFLERLSQTPYSAEEFAKLKIQYPLDRRVDGPAGLEKQLERAGRGSMTEMLEVATRSLHWAWLIEGDHITIIAGEAVINRKLARKVSENYPNKHLAFILFDLARQADVHFFMKPGAFRKTLLGDGVDQYTLNLSKVSIRQALEQIRADTGLDYTVKYDGVHIGPAEDILMEKFSPVGGDDDPFVAKASISVADGGVLEFLLHDSELNADARALRERAKREFLARAKSLAASQPASQSTASAPASQPVENGG